MNEFPHLTPLVRQMHEAADDRQRALLLLKLPDSILLKYAGEIDGACRRAHFDAGRAFVLERVTSMRAIRDDAGVLPPAAQVTLVGMRRLLADYASGKLEFLPDHLWRPE